MGILDSSQRHSSALAAVSVQISASDDGIRQLDEYEEVQTIPDAASENWHEHSWATPKCCLHLSSTSKFQCLWIDRSVDVDSSSCAALVITSLQPQQPASVSFASPYVSTFWMKGRKLACSG